MMRLHCARNCRKKDNEKVVLRRHSGTLKMKIILRPIPCSVDEASGTNGAFVTALWDGAEAIVGIEEEGGGVSTKP